MIVMINTLSIRSVWGQVMTGALRSGGFSVVASAEETGAAT